MPCWSIGDAGVSLTPGEKRSIATSTRRTSGTSPCATTSPSFLSPTRACPAISMKASASRPPLRFMACSSVLASALLVVAVLLPELLPDARVLLLHRRLAELSRDDVVVLAVADVGRHRSGIGSTRAAALDGRSDGRAPVRAAGVGATGSGVRCLGPGGGRTLALFARRRLGVGLLLRGTAVRRAGSRAALTLDAALLAPLIASLAAPLGAFPVAFGRARPARPFSPLRQRVAPLLLVEGLLLLQQHLVELGHRGLELAVQALALLVRSGRGARGVSPGRDGLSSAGVACGGRLRPLSRPPRLGLSALLTLLSLVSLLGLLGLLALLARFPLAARLALLGLVPFLLLLGFLTLLAALGRSRGRRGRLGDRRDGRHGGGVGEGGEGGGRLGRGDRRDGRHGGWLRKGGNGGSRLRPGRAAGARQQQGRHSHE